MLFDGRLRGGFFAYHNDGFVVNVHFITCVIRFFFRVLGNEPRQDESNHKHKNAYANERCG